MHVAAPSRATDDVVYRQLAQTYMCFQPKTRTLLPPSQPQITKDGTGLVAGAETDNSQPQAPHSSSQVFATPAPEELFPPDSQDLSFQSALDNRSSPSLPKAKSNSAQEVVPSSQANQPRTQESWCAPPSQISDSYPLPDASVLYVSPTRVLQRFLSGSSSCKQSQASSLASRQPKTITPKPKTQSDQIDVPSSIPIPSSPPLSISRETGSRTPKEVIPVTPAVSKPLARKRQEETEDLAMLDITHVSSTDTSLPVGTSSFRSESEPPASKRPRTRLEHPEIVALARSSSDTGPLRSSDTSNPDHDTSNTLEIRSPSPLVGVGGIELASFVSDKFAKLEKAISRKYDPELLRPIHPLERGYWLVDCTRWNAKTMRRVWNFLTTYLSRGYAGWGVWCRRGPNHDWIRMYCWGHVVKYTYLLLYLASDRELKFTGAEWHDGDGEVALRVLPREKHAS